MVGSVGGSGVVGGVGGVVGEVRAALGASWKPLVVGAAIGAAATGAGVYLWQRAARKANEQSLETSVADMAASLRSICAVLKDTRAQAQVVMVVAVVAGNFPRQRRRSRQNGCSAF